MIVGLLAAACGSSSDRNLSDSANNSPTLATISPATTTAPAATSPPSAPPVTAAPQATTTTLLVPPTPPTPPTSDSTPNTQPSTSVIGGIGLMRCAVSYYAQTLTQCRTLNKSITTEEAVAYNGSRDNPKAITAIFSTLFGREVSHSIIGKDTFNVSYVWFVPR